MMLRMYIYKIVDADEPRIPLAYSATEANAMKTAQAAADNYEALDFQENIEVHRYRADDLFLGGIYWDTLFETVPFGTAIAL